MYHDDNYVKLSKRGLAMWLGIGLLIGLSFFPARWCYQRLKAAEQIFVYFNGELAGPDGKGVGFNRATVLERQVRDAVNAVSHPAPVLQQIPATAQEKK